MSSRQTAKKRANEEGGDHREPKKTRATIEDTEQQTAETPTDNTVDANENNATEITITTRPNLSLELVARLNQLNTHVGKTTCSRALSRLDLSELHWGALAQGKNDRAPYMCIEGNVVSVWSVAELIGIKLWVKQDGRALYPQAHPSVLFMPLLKPDFLKAQDILRRFSNPTKEPESADGIWTGRWMVKYGTDVRSAPVMDKLYDARSKYESKLVMDPYPPEKLAVGDIVLLEMLIVRSHVKNKDDNGDVEMPEASTSTAPPSPVKGSPSKGAQFKKFEKKPWVEWRVDFRLNSLSVLRANEEASLVGEEDIVV
ncbi:hypothetical protein EIP86_007991 [Pleurotus ostreatoroseus]|nr:hypothetical protein EIP86_007991 [Pleurotus ostreatoroseus]